jgi:hypothetical protein
MIAFSDNTATGVGGGIANFMGSARLERTTVCANRAANVGGGIYSQAVLRVMNSTLSRNDVGGVGGGIATVGGEVILTNTTLADNRARDDAGAIFASDARFGSKVTLENTIVANNSGRNCAGPISDGGSNIQFPGADCGTTITSVDPRLDAAGLATHGGPTETIALRPGSPAINAGNQATCKGGLVRNVDQRGFVRPGMANVNCCIGAYEFNSHSPASGRQ